MSENDSSDHSVGNIVSPENLALLKSEDRPVIMGAGLIVMALLGAATSMSRDTERLMWLVIVAMVIVAMLVGLIALRAYSMRGKEAELLNMQAAAKAINGNWWQLVYTKDHPGLTFLSIAISEVAERHAMQGITFDEHGVRWARWSSDAVAIRTTSPLELFYIWRGTKLRIGDPTLISGMGRFRFDSVGHEGHPLQGEGVFNSGEISKCDFHTPRAVELVRFSVDENRRLKENPQVLPELAREAFARFELEPGRSFRPERREIPIR